MLYIYKWERGRSIRRRYDEIDYIRDSDHSPVYGAVTLRIGPNSNKGSTFKKVETWNHADRQIIPTIPREEMFRVACQNTLLRLLVNNRGLIEPMRAQVLNEASEYFSPAYIHRDTLIIKSGDSASASLLFIVKGQVKLVTPKYALATLGPGDWFGGEALIDDVSGYTAIAEDDTVCLSLSVSGRRGAGLRRSDRADDEEGASRAGAVGEAAADGAERAGPRGDAGRADRRLRRGGGGDCGADRW